METRLHSSRNTSFLTPYILVKVQWGNPSGTPNTRWVGKICDFRQITRCISKTVQGRCIVSMKRENSRLCTGWAKKVIPLVHIFHCTRGITFLAHPVYAYVISNGDIAEDHEWPQLSQIISILRFESSFISSEWLKLESSNFVPR